MEQFKFSLQKLLDIRKDKEEESKIKFMESQRQRNIVEEKLNGLRESYAKYNTVNNDLSLVEKKIRNNYLNALNSGIETADKELQEKNRIVNINREELKNKQVDRKTVEIIKDKRYEEFKKEEERKEQVQNDEFALYAYIRKLEGR